MEAANFSKRYDAQCRRFFDRKAAQTKTVVATKALACKLAKAAWHMMSEKAAYDPSRIFPGQTAPSAVMACVENPKARQAAGAPIGGGPASPLRVATGAAASGGSKARRRRSPAPPIKRRD